MRFVANPFAPPCAYPIQRLMETNTASCGGRGTTQTAVNGRQYLKAFLMRMVL
jgi:hypothetical protein